MARHIRDRKRQLAQVLSEENWVAHGAVVERLRWEERRGARGAGRHSFDLGAWARSGWGVVLRLRLRLWLRLRWCRVGRAALLVVECWDAGLLRRLVWVSGDRALAFEALPLAVRAGARAACWVCVELLGVAVRICEGQLQPTSAYAGITSCFSSGHSFIAGRGLSSPAAFIRMPELVIVIRKVVCWCWNSRSKSLSEHMELHFIFHHY